ncbi:MAG: EAL domain-containing protein, partial [Methylococcales bacterium]
VKSWGLFLQSKFFISDFTIYSVANKHQVSQSTQFLQDIFVAVLLLAIAVIVFFSLLLIRRNMIPLENLMEGMKRVSDNDFKYQIAVNSNNEFGELANSFNKMSSQLRHTVNVLTTMAEIDRLILSDTKLQKIITITITRLTGAINCNAASVILLDSKADASKNIRVFYKNKNGSGKIMQQKSAISKLELSAVFSESTLFINDADNSLPNYVAPLVASGARNFLIVPISVRTKSAAMLVFGYNDQYTPDGNDCAYAREFADHFAVALSNVSWKSKLHSQANYDTVTNLPNRHLVNRKLKNAIADARENNKQFAVLFLDLDRFKSVNDSLGHSAGDKLLKMISKRIKSCLPENCLLGRLGGDEFIILIHNLKNSKQIEKIVKHILDTLKHPFILKMRKIHIATSIGVAIYPDHGLNRETLLKNADAAMYHAKSIGRGGHEYYSVELNAADAAKLEIEGELHLAMQNEEFELYYQPQVNVNSGLIVGAEALIRWNHPSKGRVPPNDFIPVAEQSGIIMELGDWVLNQACKQNKLWQMQGLPNICMSVNLTSKQFAQTNLVTLVKHALYSNNLNVEYLDLEITESAAMVDVKKTLATLNELRALGLSLSVDDYGTGYSSLSYLKDFPIQTLKIDQSFIRDMTQVPKNMAIVKSTIILGHHLNLNVVAEGVENADELAFLKAEGCKVYQGYLFSPPVPADQFAKLLADQANHESSEGQLPPVSEIVVS